VRLVDHERGPACASELSCAAQARDTSPDDDVFLVHGPFARSEMLDRYGLRARRERSVLILLARCAASDAAAR